MITQAVLYATEKHKGQKRMGGKPYVSHPLEVAEILEKKDLAFPIFFQGYFMIY